MSKSKLINYLLNSNLTTNYTDPYFNNVDLLLKLDKYTNTQGYPLYKDYSTNQYQIRYTKGSAINSDILFIDNFTGIDVDLGESNNINKPLIAKTGNIDIDSYLYFPNSENRALRLLSINNQVYSNYVRSTHLEVFLNGNTPIVLDDEFTIEFSFYAEDVNIPWKYQSILSAGYVFNGIGLFVGNIDIKDYVNIVLGRGYAVYLKDDVLIFFDGNIENIILENVNELEWYHICICRENVDGDLILKTYVNFIKTSEVVHTIDFSTLFTTDFIDSQYLVTDSIQNRLNIASTSSWTENVIFALNPSILNQADMSFTGGLSNIRFTNTVCRYKQDIYSTYLPFYTASVGNKLDSDYNKVVLNYPFNLDCFDYSSNNAHLIPYSKANLKTPNQTLGYYYLDTVNTINSKNITYNVSNPATYLNADEWCIEFFLTYFINGNHFQATDTNLNVFPYNSTSFRYRSVPVFLQENGFFTVNVGDQVITDETINVIQFTNSTNKKILELNLRVLYESHALSVFDNPNNFGIYLGLNLSEDGTDWVEFPESIEEYWIDYRVFQDRLTLPTDELRLFRLDDRTNTDLVIRSPYDDIQTHIVIQKYNDVLYVLYDGKVINSIPFTYDVYQSTTDLIAYLNNKRFQEIALVKDGNNLRLGFGIKGLKVTNKAVYSTVNTNITPNPVNFTNSSYPLALNSDSLTPPRARILNISRELLTPSVSTTTVSWFVFVTQVVDNLVLADFTLTQLDGVTGATLVSLTKINNFTYKVIANTGTGNGKLGLNFIDRKTVRYAGSTTLISNAIGELSYLGEEYTINKNAPVPLLTSGTSPYVSTDFIITLSFDAAISDFNIEKLGLVNAIVTKVEIIDEDNHIYNITLTPVREGVIVVQAMPGLGVTDSLIPSTISLPLTKIFSSYFPILQAPLNNSDRLQDLSPSNATIEEINVNTTNYNTTFFPLGETSSLAVSPFTENSGLIIDDFNPIASASNISSDWTIEFFLRINSNNTTVTDSKLSHILSIDNGSKGISIFSKEGKFKIQRSTTSEADIFSGLDFKDIATDEFVEWSDTNFTVRDKFPHFAITKQGNVYRFYINGQRVQLITYNGSVDITKGQLYIGYLANRINDIDYYFSNVRLTHGKALYTSAVVNVPGLPYNVLPNITEITSILNYISIYSNNSISNIARTGDKINIKFSAIIGLTNTPVVTILGRSASVIRYIDPNNIPTNIYTAEITVLSTDIDEQVDFEISILNEPFTTDTIFTDTTNNSFVIVDNTSLTCNIYTDTLNTNAYLIPTYVEFSEEVQSFTLEKLTLSNCLASNLRKLTNQNVFTFDITSLSSGTISVQLEENKVQDRAGNYNSDSNIFTRNTVLPAYVPDQYWNNVILLMQSTSVIGDQSTYNHAVTSSNVDISNNTNPTSVDKSYYFTGKDSYIRANLTQSLPSTSAYTIEMYMYIQSSAVIRLNAPNILPCSEITSSSFKVNWEEVDDANNYSIDISKVSSFSSFLPSYKNLSVGDTTSHIVSNSLNNNIPTINRTYFRATQGVVPYWSRIFNEGYLGYRVDVAQDENFNNKLYLFNNRFNVNNSIAVGDIRALEKVIPEISDPDNNSFAGLSGDGLITGLLTQNTVTSKNKLLYILEESSVRLYDGDKQYQVPGVIFDNDLFTWQHIAITCDGKYSYLYRNGVLEDRMKAVSWSSGLIDIGKDLLAFTGYLQGIRITKGVNRYTSNFTPPLLPYGQS